MFLSTNDNLQFIVFQIEETFHEPAFRGPSCLFRQTFDETQLELTKGLADKCEVPTSRIRNMVQ